MSRFAEGTEVPAARSREEIERTLRRYGADAFGYAWEGERAVVQFRAGGRFIKFELPMPDPNAQEFTHTPGRGVERSVSQREKAYDAAIRQRWRALNLVIKAKLEAVDSGITTFDEEFLAHLMLPNGQTVGSQVIPEVEQAYLDGKSPRLLLEHV